MEKYYYISIMFVNVIFVTYILILLIKLVIDFIKAVKKSKKTKEKLIKKYDSGYKEMYGTLIRAMNLKNDNSSYFEEKTLEELKEKINARINAIKGNQHRKQR